MKIISHSKKETESWIDKMKKQEVVNILGSEYLVVKIIDNSNLHSLGDDIFLEEIIKANVIN